MEGFLNLEVKTTSSENIRPSSPTPNHLKYLKLSLLDQLHNSSIIPVLLFYPANNASETSSSLDITNLKVCLSRALDSFYPLAGRLDSSTIQCNDQGIPLIETRVNCPLSMVLKYSCSPYRLDILGKFCPPMSLLLGESGVQIAIQINVFDCRGVVLAIYFTHKVMDGTAISTFLRHWAALSSQRNHDLAQLQPDFEVATTAFPPLPEGELPREKSTVDINQDNNENEIEPIVIKSFIFKNSAVVDLKAKAASEQVPNPSRFLALAGYLWEQIWLATSMKIKAATSSAVTVAVNLRPSTTNPPIRKLSIGNLYDTTLVRAKNGAGIRELVAELYGSISKTKDIVAEYKGTTELVQVVFERMRELSNSQSECKENFYVMASWFKCSGFDDVDFGFGKPKWIVPTDGLYSSDRNLICVTEYADSDGDGFEAWLFLEEKTMEILESSQEFLSFCSPHF